MYSYYPVIRDFILAARSLLERYTSPDNPSLMQTSLFRRDFSGFLEYSGTVVEGSPGQIFDRNLKGQEYYCLEALRIEPGRYSLAWRRVDCFDDRLSLTKRHESVGQGVFTREQAARILSDWEEAEFGDPAKTLIRMPMLTPFHCDRWVSMSSRPPDEGGADP